MRVKIKVPEVKRPKKLSDALGRDLIQIFTDKHGDRYVWFLGYATRDKSKDLGFVWHHFVYNIVPLEVFMADTSVRGETFNHFFNHDEEVCLEEIDKYDVRFYYSDADTEEATPFLDRLSIMEDGYYIV